MSAAKTLRLKFKVVNWAGVINTTDINSFQARHLPDGPLEQAYAVLCYARWATYEMPPEYRSLKNDYCVMERGVWKGQAHSRDFEIWDLAIPHEEAILSSTTTAPSLWHCDVADQIIHINGGAGQLVNWVVNPQPAAAPQQVRWVQLPPVAEDE